MRHVNLDLEAASKHSTEVIAARLVAVKLLWKTRRRRRRKEEEELKEQDITRMSINQRNDCKKKRR